MTPLQPNRWAAALLVLVFGQACNCGKPSGSPDGGTDGGPPGPTFCAQLAARACDFFIRCHSEQVPGFDVTESRGLNDQVASSERARCEARLSEDPSCVTLAEGLRVGRGQLDDAGFAGCLDLLYPTSSCLRDGNRILAQHCNARPFLIPATPTGGSCTQDTECIAGYCSATSSTSCGACQPYQPIGGPCTRDSQCDPSTGFCPGPDGTSGACTTYKPVGASCTFTDSDLEECGPSGVCALTPLPRCAVGKALGEPCTPNAYQCARSFRSGIGLLCAPGTTPDGGAGNVCVQAQLPPGGSGCGTGEGVPGAGAGPFCSETEYCDAGTCLARKAAGQPCGADGECAAGTRCPSDAGTCLAYADTSGACSSSTSADCKNFLLCRSSQCSAEYARIGEPCSSSTCAEGTCVTVPSPAVCKPLFPDGTNCSSGFQCASYQCSTTCQAACWKG